MDEYQPRFSRNSLNLLMFATLGLILLFNLPQLLANRDQLTLPTPPPLNLTTWRTDSGAKVWFSPFMGAETAHIELWYRAGGQFDQHGESPVLAELLSIQAQRSALPVQVQTDQDFIKIRARFSRQATRMRQQVEALRKLIYFPELPTQDLQSVRQSLLPSASDALRAELYGRHHGYGQAPSEQALNTLTRANIQQFHHAFLHPERLHVALVADLSTTTARVLLERLLPVSPHLSSNVKSTDELAFNHARDGSLMLLNWPPLQDQTTDLDMALSAAILKSRYGDLVQWLPGLSNSQFQLQTGSEPLSSDWDSKTILTTKRRLALKWIRQTQAADSLSRYLIHLNAYGLPQDYMHKQIERLQAFDQGRWQQVLNTLLAPVVSSHDG